MNVQTLSKDMTGATRARAVWLTALTMVLIIAQSIAAHARPDSFADLAETISPSVVNITTSTVVAQGTGPSPIVPDDHHLRISFASSVIGTVRATGPAVPRHWVRAL